MPGVELSLRVSLRFSLANQQMGWLRHAHEDLGHAKAWFLDADMHENVCTSEQLQYFHQKIGYTGEELRSADGFRFLRRFSGAEECVEAFIYLNEEMGADVSEDIEKHVRAACDDNDVPKLEQMYNFLGLHPEFLGDFYAYALSRSSGAAARYLAAFLSQTPSSPGSESSQSSVATVLCEEPAR